MTLLEALKRTRNLADSLEETIEKDALREVLLFVWAVYQDKGDLKEAEATGQSVASFCTEIQRVTEMIK